MLSANNEKELKRHSGETELAFISRLGKMKDSGILDMTWNELTKIFNRELRERGEKYTESAYRKKYATIKQFNNDCPNVGGESAEAKELRNLKREIEKEKVKIRDERNEYRKLIRQEARKESYYEQFISSIENAASKHALQYNPSMDKKIVCGDSTIVVPLTDIHLGIKTYNYWNKYDEDVFRSMLNDYLNKIIEVAQRHCAENVVVLCSEAVSGNIHESLQIQNNQDLIDQFLTATDYICDFLYELSIRFNNIDFYVAPGNHSRISRHKDDSLAHENMDCLIVPFVRGKMQNYPNIHCYDNKIDSSIAVFSIHNHTVVFAHGDKDPVDSAFNNITKMIGQIPDIIVLGHKHYNMYTTNNNTKIIQSGSFVGPDDYAISKRLIGRPEQTLFIVNDNGLECIYDVKF